ncbi:aspartate/glutamate racemase family protein [Sphingomonas flavalba]|uniref:aspartate/glutamate racemase family protein n=1 Tax=Sphingomonas flavalba TaxID=2559804 RepID=UPI0039DFC021
MKKHIFVLHPAVGPTRDPAELAGMIGADVTITVGGLDAGPVHLASQYEVALAVPDCCAKARQAEAAGVDAIVIDCMGDVGVAEIRENVRIPVLGPYQTSLAVASLLGQRCGIATMARQVVPVMYAEARRYGFADAIAALDAIDMSVAEMAADPEERDRRLADLCRRMVERDGADTIILGCTEMLGAETRLSATLRALGADVAVVQPLVATIAVAAAMLDARLAHSKTAYPFPMFGNHVGYPHLGGAA